jgi:hypothetical protein
MPVELTATGAETNDASWVSASHRVFAAGKATYDADGLAIAVPGVLATDIVMATVESDDTGGTLGGIESATPTVDTVTIVTNAAKTNDDGVVAYVVLRAIS